MNARPAAGLPQRRGGAGLVASGIGAGIAGYGAAVGSMSGALLGGAGAGSGATAAAGGLILAAPVLIGVGITFVAGPLYGYADRAAADMLSGLPYVQAVLPAGVR